MVAHPARNRFLHKPRHAVDRERRTAASVRPHDSGQTEDVWGAYFRQQSAYVRPKLDLFNGRETACGAPPKPMGPFYCPGDQLSLSRPGFLPGNGHALPRRRRFRTRLRDRARGRSSRAEPDSAHGQGRRGTAPGHCRWKVPTACRCATNCRPTASWRLGQPSQAQLNWTAGRRRRAALNAARVGDDTLQKQARGYAVPDSFTHGSAAQRQRWFKAGFDSGDIVNCDTSPGKRVTAAHDRAGSTGSI